MRESLQQDHAEAYTCNASRRPSQSHNPRPRSAEARGEPAQGRKEVMGVQDHRICAHLGAPRSMAKMGMIQV
jgi:hypothetical protein